MEKMKVVITDYEYESIAQEREIIAAAGAELFDYQCRNGDGLIAATQDADAVIVQYAAMTADVIEHLQHCKVILKYGIGVNNIDVEAAAKKGIAVCNVPDYGIDEVANQSIAFLLALAKKLPIVTRALRGGDWSVRAAVPLFRLSGAVLGLVGFGRIPQDVARKMLGFGMRVIAYDPYASPEEAARMGVTLVDFDTLCRKSDFISLHCPLTKETTHLIDREALSKMKPTAFLINTARGPVVSEPDLIAALEAGALAGAALDVFEDEPLAQSSPLLKLEHVICTPHCAWYSEEAIATLQRKAAEEVVHVLAGNPPRSCVNRAALAAGK